MGFGMMISGFFFIIFEFNIGKINILPDFLGFFIIYLGTLKGIRKLSNHYFAVLKKASILLMFLSGLDMAIKYVPIINGVMNDYATVHGKLFSILFTITMVSMMIFLVFTLTKGIEIEANKTGEKDLVFRAGKVFKLYCFFELIILFVFIFFILVSNASTNFSIDGIAAIPFLILIYTITIYLFVQFRKLLKQAENVIRQSVPAE